jgi:hypothetical protein
MEDEVVNAALNGTEDSVLALLIEITREVLLGRGAIAEAVMDEPIFWRRFFKRWVQNALDEDRAIEEDRNNALREINNRLGKG